MSNRTSSRIIRLALASAAAALVLGAGAEAAVIASGPAHSPAAHTAMVPQNDPWWGPSQAPTT